ncbi:MAG TPA: CAP domain-containing protein [Bryobacteraceae bacterium]|nr:CAP domain-containing protein [Bryobacteraceae bacterium]
MCLIFVAFTLICGAEWHHTSITNHIPEPAAALPGDILAAHNAVRERLDLTPLRWSDHLTAYAQEWANQLLHEGQFHHRSHPKYGENLFEIDGPRATPANVVDIWAAEERDYSYRTNTCRGMCGHYTQLIWSTTREVGCAVARDANREVWVCNYDPPGNWLGERPY